MDIHMLVALIHIINISIQVINISVLQSSMIHAHILLHRGQPIQSLLRLEWHQVCFASPIIVSAVRSMSMPAAAATAFGRGWVEGVGARTGLGHRRRHDGAWVGPWGGWGAKSIPGGWIQYPVRGFIPRLVWLVCDMFAWGVCYVFGIFTKGLWTVFDMALLCFCNGCAVVVLCITNRNIRQ